MEPCISNKIPMTNKQPSRREFLKESITLAAVGGAASYVNWSQKAFANVAANDRPIIGLIGTGHQSMQTAPVLARFGDIAAVCDVDSRHANPPSTSSRQRQG